MRSIPRRKAADVYTVTEAHRPLSEDIRHRQRRYLVSMGIRTVCILVAVLLADHVPLWALLIPLAGAVVLPYVSVVVANGGREPEKAPTLGSGHLREPSRMIISGPTPKNPS